MSGQAVHLVHVAAGYPQCRMVLADGFLVRPFEQAIHRAFGVVVELDLADPEPVGPRVAGVVGDLRDGLRWQLQVSWKSMNRGTAFSL